MFKIILVSVLSLIPQSRSLGAEAQTRHWSEVCATAEGSVLEGDLVFLDIPIFLFRQVAIATRSWTSHVGVVFKSPEGEWVVSEATFPLSKETPLCDYLKKSSDYKFEIKRLSRPLNESEISRMRVQAQSMIGEVYGLGFNFDSERTFCSKFAYLIYQAIGIELGSLQSFGELISENPESSLTFWRFWFLGKIPLERRTVTPASQLHDQKFITVLKGV